MKASQEKNPLTAGDICSILEKCGETGVTKLEFRGLCVEFGPKASPIPEPAPMAAFTSTDKAPLPSSETAISEVQSQEAERSFISDELALRDEQFAEILLTDPATAEKMQINDALEEPSHGSNDE